MSNMFTPPKALTLSNPDFIKGYDSRLSYMKAIELNMQKIIQNIQSEKDSISFTVTVIEELEKSLDYLCKTSKILSLREYKNIINDIENLHSTIKKSKAHQTYLESVLLSDKTSLAQAQKELKNYIASNKLGEVLEFKRRS